MHFFKRTMLVIPCFGYLIVLQITIPCDCIKMLPVYDLKTDETFAFPEDYLKVVLAQQSSDEETSSYSSEPLDKEGYIINENGHLVPFKIYKKGGSRLHPRNCRGGFHKRLISETLSDGIERSYEDPIYKRKLNVIERRTLPKTYYSVSNDVIFKPRVETRSIQHGNVIPAMKPNQIQEDIYSIYSLLNDDKEIGKILDKYSVSHDNIKALKNMKEANFFLGDLAKEIQKVGDPPPLERTNHIRAEIEEYPAFKLWTDFDSLRNSAKSSEDGLSVISPLEYEQGS